MRIQTATGKPIGTLRDGVFRKVVKGSLHKLKDPEGWAIDKDIVESLALLNCRRMVIRDRETKTTYWAWFTDFQENALELERGHGKQLVLPLNKWEIATSEQ